MGKSAKVQSKIGPTQHDYKTPEKKASYRALSELISLGKEEIQEESYQKAESIKNHLIEDAIWELDVSEDSDVNTTEDATEESSEDSFDNYSTSLEYFWNDDSSEEEVGPYDANRFFSSKPQSASSQLLQELIYFKI
jgi:hypothetical protein